MKKHENLGTACEFLIARWDTRERMTFFASIKGYLTGQITPHTWRKWAKGVDTQCTITICKILYLYLNIVLIVHYYLYSSPKKLSSEQQTHHTLSRRRLDDIADMA